MFIGKQVSPLVCIALTILMLEAITSSAYYIKRENDPYLEIVRTILKRQRNLPKEALPKYPTMEKPTNNTENFLTETCNNSDEIIDDCPPKHKRLVQKFPAVKTGHPSKYKTVGNK